MADPDRFTWKHKELVAVLLKEAKVHEGRWFLAANFGMGGGNFGQTEDQLNPGVVIMLGSIGIQREMPEAKAPQALVVDAAEVNPAPKARGKAGKG